MRIFIFGGSITQGFFDATGGGWAQRLATEFHHQTLQSINDDGDFYSEVFNLGVSGDTAEGVLNRMKQEVEARRLYEDEDSLVISVGMNDSVLIENIAALDVYDFQEILEKLVKEARKLTDNIIFVGLTAVDEDLTNPYKTSSTGKQFKNNRIDLFEDTVKQVAEMNDISFVPIYDKFLEGINSGHNLLSDGLHPNDAGHKLVTDLVRPYIQEYIK